jgi:DNA-binding CsgD family transcriptional regulator
VYDRDKRIGGDAAVGNTQRVSLRKFADDVKRWVDEGRSDDWIASALGTSSSSVQSFRSRNGIYRKNPGAALAEPVDYEAYEGVVECDASPPGAWFDPAVADDPRWQRHWNRIGRVEVRLSPTKIVIVGRGGQRALAGGSGNGLAGV